MRKSTLFVLTLFTLLLLPTLAMAGEGTTVPATRDAAVACAQPSFVVAAAQPAASPIENNALTGSLCCALRQARCEIGCFPQGVFEFSCDPSTCQSSCICNIGP